MYYFTADQHFGHFNSIRHSNRPFETVEEMDSEIIYNFNSVVSKNDITIHAGDFAWVNSEPQAVKYINQLNGQHIFLKGSHDKWMGRHYHEIWEKTIEGIHVVVCHYCLRTWARSHYNSWHCFGHSHGRLKAEGKSWDVGVDNNHYYPVSFEQLKEIMKSQPDNFNLIKKGK